MKRCREAGSRDKKTYVKEDGTRKHDNDEILKKGYEETRNNETGRDSDKQ